MALEPRTKTLAGALAAIAGGAIAAVSAFLPWYEARTFFRTETTNALRSDPMGQVILAAGVFIVVAGIVVLARIPSVERQQGLGFLIGAAAVVVVILSARLSSVIDAFARHVSSASVDAGSSYGVVVAGVGAAIAGVGGGILLGWFSLRGPKLAESPRRPDLSP